MSQKRVDYRRIKKHRSYTMEEVARLLRVHKNTVRNWLRDGLTAMNDSRPILIQGEVLKAYLQDRQHKTKRPCPQGTLYRLKCRVPRRPAMGMVDFVQSEGGAGNLLAVCEVCETMMCRRARKDALPVIMPGIEVQLRQVQPRLCESP